MSDKPRSITRIEVEPYESYDGPTFTVGDHVSCADETAKVIDLSDYDGDVDCYGRPRGLEAQALLSFEDGEKCWIPLSEMEPK